MANDRERIEKNRPVPRTGPGPADDALDAPVELEEDEAAAEDSGVSPFMDRFLPSARVERS